MNRPHPPRTRFRRHAVAGGALATLAAISLVLGVWPSFAAAEVTVAAWWQMNESAGETVMADSGPYGLHGAIGDVVDIGGGSYTWPDVQPNAVPVTPGRLVTVAHDPNLNPELEDFEIEFRYRTTENFGNVVQKGQNLTEGGYFKIEQPFGFVTCLFKDADGTQKAAQARTSTSDGKWHTIRCQLDRSYGANGAIRIFVDGELDQINALTVPVGRVSNDWPIAIGGKYQCNQVMVECDYFEGELDYLLLRRGNLPAPPPPTTDSSPWIRRGAHVAVPADRGSPHPLG